MSVQRYVTAANLMVSKGGPPVFLVGGYPTRLLKVSGADFIQQAAGSPLRHFFASWAPVNFRTTAVTRSPLAALLVRKGLLHPVTDGSNCSQPVSSVTVVIPVKDSQRSLQWLLESLRAYLSAGVQVIVVDDGSHVPVDPRQGEGIQVVRFGHNQGPAAARNYGFQLASTPYVAFIDADCWVNSGWLEKSLGHFDDQRVAIVAPRIVGDRARDFTSAIDEFECARSSLDMGAEPALVAPHTPVAYVPSAALVVHKERATTQLGTLRLFDERLRCGEDVDLCWRLSGTDGLIRYEPTATVGHDHRIDPARWVGRKYFYGTSAATLACTHGHHVAPMVKTPLMLLIAAGLWSGRRPGIAIACGALLYSQYSLSGKIPVPALAAAVNASMAWASIDQAASVVWRVYWPVSLISMMAFPAMRIPLGAMAVYDAVRDWRLRGIHRVTSTHVCDVRAALSHMVLHRVEGMAYACGVHAGFSRKVRQRRGWQARYAILPYLKR